MDIDLVTPDGNVQVQGAVIFRVLRGEWHLIQLSGDTLVMHTETDLPYSQMDLVVQWPPQSGSEPSLFLPSASGDDARALAGLGTLFGISSERTSTYTSMNGGSPELATAWKSYSCLLGDELPNGTKLTEVIMTGGDGRVIRGGWVFTEPGTSANFSDQPGNGNNSEDGSWLSLPANRFAIVGGNLGALFGTGRLLYFQSGVSDTFRAKVRSEFGFGANEGASAQIRVKDFGVDFLLEVTPVPL
ncbi:MAG: hypothetical protein ABIO92_08670 [Chloroflexia bacterium]